MKTIKDLKRVVEVGEEAGFRPPSDFKGVNNFIHQTGDRPPDSTEWTEVGWVKDAIEKYFNAASSEDEEVAKKEIRAGAEKLSDLQLAALSYDLTDGNYHDLEQEVSDVIVSRMGGKAKSPGTGTSNPLLSPEDVLKAVGKVDWSKVSSKTKKLIIDKIK